MAKGRGAASCGYSQQQFLLFVQLMAWWPAAAAVHPTCFAGWLFVTEAKRVRAWVWVLWVWVWVLWVWVWVCVVGVGVGVGVGVMCKQKDWCHALLLCAAIAAPDSVFTFKQHTTSNALSVSVYTHTHTNTHTHVHLQVCRRPRPPPWCCVTWRCGRAC